MISALFVLSLLSGGAASATYASDNDDFYNDYEDLCTNQNANQFNFVEDVCNDIKRVRDSEAASAVSYTYVLDSSI